MKPASKRILTPSSSIGSEIRTFNIGSTVRGCSWRLCQRRSQFSQERLSSDCYRVPDGSQRWRIACLNLRKILNGQSEMGCHGCEVTPECRPFLAYQLSPYELPLLTIRQSLHSHVLSPRIVGKPRGPRYSH